MFPPSPNPDLPREQNASNLSVSQPTSAKRPKLSLQTSLGPQSASQKPITALSYGVAVDSPTSRNTYTNAFKGALSPIASGRQNSSTVPSPNSSHSSSTSNSPTAPYVLPIGARSILRNSPLPPRHVTTTARTSKRLFRPAKRVVFGDCLVELIPDPVLEDVTSDSESTSSESSSSSSSNMPDDAPPSTPVCRRQRKRRDWVWTIGRTDEPGPSSPNGGHYLKNERWGLPEEPTLSEAPTPASASVAALQGHMPLQSTSIERSTALPIPPSRILPSHTSTTSPALHGLKLEQSATPRQSPRPELISLPNTPTTISATTVAPAIALRTPMVPKSKRTRGKWQRSRHGLRRYPCPKRLLHRQ